MEPSAHAQPPAPRPGDDLLFVLDDGTTIPATVIGPRSGGWAVRIEAGHLRIDAAVVTNASGSQLRTQPSGDSVGDPSAACQQQPISQARPQR